jgi:hypothetical protein
MDFLQDPIEHPIRLHPGPGDTSRGASRQETLSVGMVCVLQTVLLRVTSLGAFVVRERSVGFAPGIFRVDSDRIVGQIVPVVPIDQDLGKHQIAEDVAVEDDSGVGVVLTARSAW